MNRAKFDATNLSLRIYYLRIDKLEYTDPLKFIKAN